MVQERAEGPKAPSPGQRPGYNVCKPVALKGQKPYVLPGVLKLLPLQGDKFASVIRGCVKTPNINKKNSLYVLVWNLVALLAFIP